MCDQSSHHVFCSIIPPEMLKNLAKNGTGAQQDAAFSTISLSAQLRGRREVINNVALVGAVPAGGLRRTVYNAGGQMTLPGKLVRGEGDAKTNDKAADEAYDSAGKTYQFYKQVLNRNSIDDRGLRLDSSVHYGFQFNNAFWNGQQMIYGDGDGFIFNRFTLSLDVIAHELTHGITQYEADLIYQDEPGALNEHFSDVFGILTLQYAKNQTAHAAEWLIGKGLFVPPASHKPGVHRTALRSMKAPGTAYNDPGMLGPDPQPDHMSKYVTTSDDNGGVHINSGIPNKAFYNFATSLGGRAWEKAGMVWYTTLCNELGSNATFQECATKSHKVAKAMYGDAVADKLRAAWSAVGIKIAGAATANKAAQKKPPLTAAAKGAKKKGYK
ncbi:MAG: M4 family metallopeptidase [Pyrinomonadaceae bacterium]